MATWIAARPEALSPGHLPFAGLITLGLGAAVFKFVAPGTTLLAFVGGVVLLVPLGASLAAAAALARVTSQVKLSQADRDALRREVSEYIATTSNKAALGGELADPDTVVDHYVPWLKLAFYAMCSPEDKDPESGELVLTRERVEQLGVELEAEAQSRAKAKAKAGADTAPESEEEACARKFAEVWGGEGVTEEERKARRALFALQLMALGDLDHDGRISFNEFASVVLTMLFADEANTKVRNDLWFRALDLNKDGLISKEELVTWVGALVKAGAVSAPDSIIDFDVYGNARPATAGEVADRWLEAFDVDHNGGISRKEFDALAEAVDFSTVMPKRDWVAVWKAEVKKD